MAPFDHAAGKACGPIRLATRDQKQVHLDKLIAAHVVALGVTLVTSKLKDFARFPGLQTQNWRLGE